MPETNILDAKTRPPKPARPWWLMASAAWIAVILFSSTRWAAVYCSRAFAWLYASTIGKHFTSHQAYDSLYYIAQKSLHLTLFFILGAALWQVFSVPPGRRLIAVVFAGFIIGASSELLQLFFPNHVPEVSDVLINTLGAFLGAAASFWRAQLESTRGRSLRVQNRH